MSQARLSHFFAPSPKKTATAGPSQSQKRAPAPIDLTGDDDDEQPPLKKPRTSSTSRAEQWRFTPGEVSATAEKDVGARRTHEGWKGALLGAKHPFVPREADADANADADMDMDEEEEAQADEKEAEAGADSGDESDPAFAALRETFARKPPKKGGAKGKKGAAKLKGKTEAEETGKRKKAGKAEVGPSGQTYTPLERQVLQLKRDHPGTLLMVAVGYKYRFFGEDAKTASSALGIVAFPQRNFLTASVPVHRLEIHLKKLLSEGYKVGIVDQMETAALKQAGDTRNTLFARGLTSLYTATTYVNSLDSLDALAPPLLCVVEQPAGGMGVDERVRVGVVVVSPGTGDVVYDHFEDNHMRTEIETRLVHTKPSELLLPATGLSVPSEKVLQQFIREPTGGCKPRIERFAEQMAYTDAFAAVSAYYTAKDKDQGTGSEAFRSGTLMEAVAGFPKLVVIALAHAIRYLSAYSVADALRETKFFTPFATRAHMLLNGNTLTNLEIYRNETDYTTKGSLMWILDRTKTKFGARLLKSWVGRPLTDRSILQQRTDAVAEILSSASGKLVVLKGLLKGLPDLAKGLCRIQYGKCTPQELAMLLPAFHRIATSFDAAESSARAGFSSALLNEIACSLPKLREPVRALVDAVHLQKTREGRKDAMWADPTKFPEIEQQRFGIDAVEAELQNELKSIRQALKRPSLRWSTSNGDEYLIELKKSEDHLVPPNWEIVTTTRLLRRYRTPAVKEKLQERAQYQEGLQAAADAAYLAFLAEIAHEHYAVLRDAVNKLATADCLFSLAHVALQAGYTRPEFVEGADVLEIVDGRHPMVEAIRSDPFIANSIRMGGAETRSKIITGPNMGGKSSCVRMTALIAIMAQIGSWVPAASVKMSMLDGILTRMGAADELARGRSTFMVELGETQNVIQTATERSLVILDELGRGTSTYDGMAIAGAVLQHLVQEVKCKTLFITHYPLVAKELEAKFPKAIANLHMGFTEDTRIDGTREITFLYRLTRGIAAGSFGVECGRLAGVPEPVLELAARRAEDLRLALEERTRRNRARKCAKMINSLLSSKTDVAAHIEDLRKLASALRTPGPPPI